MSLAFKHLISLENTDSKMLARSIKTISFKVSSRYLSHSSMITNFLNMSSTSTSTSTSTPILFYLTHLEGGFPYMLHMFSTHPPCLCLETLGWLETGTSHPSTGGVLVLGSPGLSPLKRYQVTWRRGKFLTWKFSPGKNGEKLKRRHVC